MTIRLAPWGQGGLKMQDAIRLSFVGVTIVLLTLSALGLIYLRQ